MTEFVKTLVSKKKKRFIDEKAGTSIAVACTAALIVLSVPDLVV